MLSHRRSGSRRKFSNIWVNRQVSLSLSPWLMDVGFLTHHTSKFHIHTCSQSSFVHYTVNTSVILLHQLCFISHASHDLKNFTGMPLCHHRACFGAEECVVNVCLCHPVTSGTSIMAQLQQEMLLMQLLVEISSVVSSATGADLPVQNNPLWMFGSQKDFGESVTSCSL